MKKLKTIHTGDVVRFNLKKSWELTVELDGLVESIEFFPTYVVAVPIDYVKTGARPKRYLVKLEEITDARGDEQRG